jgi:hypothetical protein
MRMILGSLAAAVLMFALGFVFFGFLFPMALSPISAEAASAAQAALGGSLPASGTYIVPIDEAAWMAGPSALINFTAGASPPMGMAMALGFLHFALSAYIIALALRAVGGDFARQAAAVLWFGLAAAFFMHLGDPIWYGYGWRMPLFTFLADGVIFIAGGLVLAKWFSSERAAAGTV